MRKRKLRRRQYKTTRAIIIFSMCLAFLGISAGYAAFSTGIVMNIKGNIKEKAISVSELKTEVVTSGDGLYKDSSEDGRYVYKGINPNNYIKLGDDMYRIIAAESNNTIKVIKYNSIGSMVIDPGYSNFIEGLTLANSNDGTRYSSNKNDYCYFSDVPTDYFGCNVWGSKYTMLDANENNVTQIRKKIYNNNLYNLPDKEAYLNTYLNNEWYGSLDYSVSNNIVSHIFNVGHINSSNKETIDEMSFQEQFYKWRGKVGLVGVLDYIKANLNTSNCSALDDSYVHCSDTSWLKKMNYSVNSQFWTISPSSIEGGNHYQWFIDSSASYITKNQAYNNKNVHPVFFLSSKIMLNGNGTEINPYILSK